jgi:Protein of unknown function (DUF3040)
MSLPPSEQQVLLRIERTLQSRDPRLMSIFAAFTRLTRHEAMPGIEQLRRTTWWLRSSIVIPVTLMLLVGIIVVGMLSGLSRTCGPVRPTPGVAGAAARACAPVSDSWSPAR